jgi:two-component system, cell cycle response regulator DivK
MYAMYLRVQGFDPIVMDDPDEALRQAAHVDLIVTGIRLRASNDGLALIQRLRQSDATRATPIIVLTACAFDEDRARAFAAGCDTFLVKPCTPEALLIEVHRLMARAQQLRVEALQQIVRTKLAGRAATDLVAESAALQKAANDEAPVRAHAPPADTDD